MNPNKLDNQDCPIDEVNSEAEMVPDFSNIPFVFSQREIKKRQKERQAVGLIEMTSLEDLRKPTRVGDYTNILLHSKRESRIRSELVTN